MKNINKLIDRNLSYAVETDYRDVATLYMEDRAAFIDIRYLLSAGYTKAAADAIAELDTSPREEILEAMVSDGYAMEDYGYTPLHTTAGVRSESPQAGDYGQNQQQPGVVCPKSA